MAEEVKKDEPKKKGPLGKLKEAVDDKEEQLLILSTFVRLGVMIWAGAILTLNYVEIPGYKQEQKIDPTFIASVFTGVLAPLAFKLVVIRRRMVIVVQIYLRKTWSF